MMDAISKDDLIKYATYNKNSKFCPSCLHPLVELYDDNNEYALVCPNAMCLDETRYDGNGNKIEE